MTMGAWSLLAILIGLASLAYATVFAVRETNP